MEKRKILCRGIGTAFKLGYMSDEETGNEFQKATLKKLQELATEQENCEFVTMESLNSFFEKKERINSANLAYIAGREARKLDGDDNCLEQRLSEYMEKVNNEENLGKCISINTMPCSADYRIKLKPLATTKGLPVKKKVNIRRLKTYHKSQNKHSLLDKVYEAIEHASYTMSTSKTKEHNAKRIFELMSTLGGMGLIGNFVGMVEKGGTDLPGIILAINAAITAVGVIGYNITKDEDKYR